MRVLLFHTSHYNLQPICTLYISYRVQQLVMNYTNNNSSPRYIIAIYGLGIFDHLS